jgi:hypothetical protein
MKSALRSLLSLVVDGGGAVFYLLRKGFSLLRSLFGGSIAKVRALLKRVLALLMDKVGPVVDKAHDKLGAALSSLRRRAESVLQRRASDSEEEPQEEEIAPESTPAPRAAASPVPSPASRSAAAGGIERSAVASSPVPLATIVPVLGSALVTLLQRPRRSGPARAAPLAEGAT